MLYLYHCALIRHARFEVYLTINVFAHLLSSLCCFRIHYDPPLVVYVYDSCFLPCVVILVSLFASCLPALVGYELRVCGLWAWEWYNNDAYRLPRTYPRSKSTQGVLALAPDSPSPCLLCRLQAESVFLTS
ncbi:hypothetical protein C8Q72DRAFT_202107 [Fomitopsis betulina]|nr:hypothetical protein C8Q72DRAFT_202107 [Fomitopsis betulina]